ncbi:MAG: glycosyltransferase family 2 protein [bacterium]
MERTSSLRIITVFFSKENAAEFNDRNRMEIEKSGILLTVVDNGENKEYVENIKNAKYIKNCSNKGYGYALNRGVEESTEDYILLVNDDIKISDAFLSGLKKRLELYRKNRYSLIGFRVISGATNRSGIQKVAYNPLVILYHFSPLPFIFSLFSKGNGYCGAGETMHSSIASREVMGVNGSIMLINREDFNRVGGFDEEYFLTYEETDLFIRLLKKKNRIFYDASLKAYHKHTLTSGEESLKYSFTSMMHFLKKHYGGICAKFVYFWIYSFLSMKKIITLNRMGGGIEYLKKP